MSYVVQVFTGGRWVKVRGHKGGPWATYEWAERIASARADAPRRPSSTEGLPHRVALARDGYRSKTGGPLRATRAEAEDDYRRGAGQ